MESVVYNSHIGFKAIVKGCMTNIYMILYRYIWKIAGHQGSNIVASSQVRSAVYEERSGKPLAWEYLYAEVSVLFNE